VALEKDGVLCIRDNGRGIPVDPHPKFKNKSALEVIMTTLHAGGKFDGKVYETSGGLHGVGASVVNALSEWMDVEVARDRRGHKMRFERGNPVGKLKDQGAVNRRGTIVTFKPDPGYSAISCSRRRGFIAWRAARPICSAGWKYAGPAIPR